MTERGYLGEVLEELRLERGLSLRDLAAQAGLTKSYLSQLESGKQKNPSLEKLRGLASALGVSITVVRDEPGYIRVSEGDPEDRSHVRSGVPTIREELDEAKDETHFKPDWTSSPGDTIADILEERGLTPEDLAGRADLSLGYVNELLKGRAVITHEVAVGLQLALGSSAEFWLEREANYRKALAGKVAIGVDPGAGPDQQAVTVWKVKDRQWTELVPSATLEPGDVMADWRERMAQMEASKSWHQMYQGVPLEREDKPTPMTPKEWVAWQLGGESERRKHGPSSYVTFAHTDNDGNTTELRWAELSEADTFTRTIHRARGGFQRRTEEEVLRTLELLRCKALRGHVREDAVTEAWRSIWEMRTGDAVPEQKDDEPKLDSKKLLQEEVGQMHEDTARSMLKHLEEWKAIEAEMKRDPNLKVMFRRAPMYEAWKAGRADSPIDPNGGNLNPHERALALERRRFEWAAAERTLADLQATDPLFKTVPSPPWLLEAYKPLPRTDAPQPDSDGAAPLGEE